MNTRFSSALGLVLVSFCFVGGASPLRASPPALSSDSYPSLSGRVIEGSPDVLFLPVNGDFFLGSTLTRFLWYKNGALIKSGIIDEVTSPSLLIEKITPDVAGNYMVRLINGDGSIDGGILPVVVSEAYPVLVTVREGQNAVFRLRVTAPPGMEISWTKDGQAVSQNGHFIIKSNGEFIVVGTTAEDDGIYEAYIGGAVVATRDLRTVSSKPIWYNVSPILPELVAGSDFTWVLGDNVANYPSGFSVSGLPHGLTFNPVNGLISGRSTQVGTFPLTLRATNAAGTSEMRTALIVSPLPAEVTGNYVAGVALINLHAIDVSAFVANSIPVVISMTVSANGLASTKVRYNDLTTVSMTLPVHFTGGVLWFDTHEAVGSPIKLETQQFVGSTNPDHTLSIQWQSAGVSGRGWKQTWDSRSHPATTFAKPYTFVTNHAWNSLIITTVGGITVSPSGVATITGSTQDGAAVVSAFPLGPTGQVMLYQPVSVRKIFDPSNPRRPPTTGYVSGLFTIGSTSQITGNLNWLGTERIASGDSIISISGPVRGGSYPVPTTKENVLGIAAGAVNARLLFTGGNLITSANVAVTLSAPARAILPRGSSNPTSTTLAIQAASGLFSGTFTQPNGKGSQKGNFRGAIIKQTDGTLRGEGFYRLPEQSVMYPSQIPTVVLESNL